MEHQFPRESGCDTAIQSIFDTGNEEVEAMAISVMQRLTETMDSDTINNDDDKSSDDFSKASQLLNRKKSPLQETSHSESNINKKKKRKVGKTIIINKNHYTNYSIYN
ncbi:hypothetical protein C1645_881849 [Glomus cerebriforme]|uniref:Uncharacterized protein n=1 Tax=Glomus cerebriforme TaxID=658196 RepID=A0A397S3L0_9GLOM|nr:hypothetical protein C1645_881849 [Glomus cerebriforme]